MRSLTIIFALIAVTTAMLPEGGNGMPSPQIRQVLAGAGESSMPPQQIRQMMFQGAGGNVMQPASNAMQPASNAMAPATNTMQPASNAMAPATNTMAPASNAIAPATNTIAPALVKQDAPPAGGMRVDLTPKHVEFVAGAVARGWKHRTLVYHVLSGQWSEIDGQAALLDIAEFEIHMWIAHRISDYLSKNLPIMGMGNAFVQIGYLAVADKYLTRQRVKGMISGMDETTVSFADKVTENFSSLGTVVVAKLSSQVNLKEKGEPSTFVTKGELQDTKTVTAFIFRVEGNVVVKVALFHCTPKHAFVHEKKTHFLLELAGNECKRTSDEVVYMMNL